MTLRDTLHQQDETVVSVDYSPGGTTYLAVASYRDGVVSIVHQEMTFVDMWPEVEALAQELGRKFGASRIVREV